MLGSGTRILRVDHGQDARATLLLLAMSRV